MGRSTHQLPPSDSGALALYGHAVTLAVGDLAQKRRTASSTENLQTFGDLLDLAAGDTAGMHLTWNDLSATTRGLLLTNDHRNGIPYTPTTAIELASLRTTIGFALSGELSRRETRALLKRLVELGSDSLSARGIASTPAGFLAHAVSTTKTAEYAIAF